MGILGPGGIEAALEHFLQREHLPDHYRAAARDWFRPLARDFAGQQHDSGGTLVVGIQGAQGTGKSTLARLLALILREGHGLRVAVLSMDDFYLDRAARQRLGELVHPLLATRGVPGTHDVKLAVSTLQSLLKASAGSQVAVPGFDKAEDDRLPADRWQRIDGPLEVVILEGWCLGAPPQTPAELEAPLNRLEREQDADGVWRRFVNGQLAGPYRHWFGHIDYLVVLQAPSFDCVYAWRGLQEQKLAAASNGSQIMTRAQLETFIAHYERLTRHCLSRLPRLADRVFLLDDQHRIAGTGSAAL